MQFVDGDYGIVTCLSSGRFVSALDGLRFTPRGGQIGHSVANGSPSQRLFFERNRTARRRNDVKVGPSTCYTLRRNAASTMKDLKFSTYN